ncbi:sulfatase-like hydrolase/transferase [Croceivirga thetidis]|uniref:Sulfatase n=1 Tax=Croceivirga thetidis TaxID=2721623 RepID=A0ABX1GLB4_9FLAO|nr:sulfatase [Croceivirga thetidis]
MRHLVLGVLFLLLVFGCDEKKAEVSDKDLTLAPNPTLSFKPNILWIVAEDMSPTIPSFGDSTIVTPHLNWLAKEGVCYDNFFSPHPVCSPARASIITGMYANSIGASHMRTGPWMHENLPKHIIKGYKSLPEENIPYEAVPPSDVRMFTEYLRQEGYYCTNNAKEDYQFIKTMTAWDESSGNGHWRNRPPNKPFFSVFNIGVTHESQIWAKALDSLWVEDDAEVPVPPYLPNTKVGQKDVRRMYSNILEMDEKVGSILAGLKEDGLLDSTIVVWYTDHGGPLPRQKRLLYEGGVKVPMIIRFPDKQFSGERDSRLISFIDLAPTTLSLAGINPPSHIQGKAFLGEYMRKTEPEFVFGAADRFDEFSDKIRSVRDKQFKYIKNYELDKPVYADVAYRKNMPIMQELLRLKKENKLTAAQALWFKNPKPKEELYDLNADPFELKNLAGDEAFSERLLKMRKACEDWVIAINDQGLLNEQDLIAEFWPGGVQPITAIPKFQIVSGQLEISCDTKGASIGYRMKNDSINGWKIYEAPLKDTGNHEIEAIAHRLGFERSEVVEYSGQE